MYRIAVLASTRGTDFQAIIEEVESGELDVEIVGLFTNKADCGATEKAKAHNIPVFVFDGKGKTREVFDQEMISKLQALKVDLVVLVGYMRILSKVFIQAFPNKILNVHPSLMPAFCGPGAMDKNVHEEVLKRGVKVTGCTIHIVNEEVDGGPILLQKTCEVDPIDTPDSLKKKVQDLEKKCYPEVIRWFVEGRGNAPNR